MESHSGRCGLDSASRLDISVDDPRVARVALETKSLLPFPGDIRPDGRIVVAVDAVRVSHHEGYELTVRPNGIQLVGGSPAGCFWGLQTLKQLIQRQSTGLAPFLEGSHRLPPPFPRGDRGGSCNDSETFPNPSLVRRGAGNDTTILEAALACCTIRDRPDFDTRGLLHDVSRGKVPTLDTLKHLIDRLAHLKINQLQLYIEHTFVFGFDADICDDAHGLTPDEVRELDRYAHDRFVRLVPAVATLGHMGRILSMNKYRHLAELESPSSWEDLDWPRRTRGLTLDCMNPDAWQLVERVLSDVLDAFSSDVINICGDEPWDLGMGKNRETLQGVRKGHAYLDHIVRTHRFCADRGRRTQFWSDVVRNYPTLFERVPKESTVLHWGYDDEAKYDETRRFVDAGLSTIVCAGTSGWKRILNDFDLAERNIAAFAAAGKKHAATGLITTDWGDHGHFNALACSWHGLATGAALAWNVDQPLGANLDASIARHCLGLPNVEVVSTLRALSAQLGACESWRLFWMPGETGMSDPTWPTVEKAVECKRLARQALLACDTIDSADADPLDVAEWSTTCRFVELFVDKVILMHPDRRAEASRETVRAWSGRVDKAATRFAKCWRRRNKSGGLNDILRALVRCKNYLATFVAAR